MNKTFGYLCAAGFVATIYAANWALERYGIVPVGFGLMAPAGVYFAGLAFGLRDAVHESLGRLWVLGCIGVGAVAAYTVSPVFAGASAVAFAVAELADFAVYEPLRERRWVAAVVASNVVGAVVDSALFLWLAFGSLDHMAGQVVAKTYMVLPAVLIVSGVRRLRAAPAPTCPHEWWDERYGLDVRVVARVCRLCGERRVAS